MPEIISNIIQLHPFRERDGRIEYLVLKRSIADALCPGIWQVITGGVDAGERSQDAARRELLEETGLEAEEWRVLEQVVSFYFEPTDQVVLSPVFACRIAYELLPELSPEHEEFRWLDIEQAIALLEFESQRVGASLVDALVSDSQRLNPVPHTQSS